MKNSVNPYEMYRKPGIPESGPIRHGHRVLPVFSAEKESIQIITADAGYNRVALGYNIYFENGRNAYRLPSLESGWYVNEQEAILFFLGYVKKYSCLFFKEAIAEVNRQIMLHSQMSLF